MNEYDRAWCFKQLTHISKLPISRPFINAVDPIRDMALDYYEIILQPMDLQTIQHKLAERRYHCIEDFVDDFRLIQSNSAIYNGENSFFSIFARDILNILVEELSKKPANAQDEISEKFKMMSKELSNLVNNPPYRISQNPPSRKMPDIDFRLLNKKQMEDVKSVTGTPIYELTERWPFLNEQTKSKLTDILLRNTFIHKNV